MQKATHTHITAHDKVIFQCILTFMFIKEFDNIAILTFVIKYLNRVGGGD